jgi:ubiquinone/menaquinone biosynthesis C-methylase UbiE
MPIRENKFREAFRISNRKEKKLDYLNFKRRNGPARIFLYFSQNIMPMSSIDSACPQPAPATDPAEMLQANKESWNVKTPVHAASDFYDLAAFKAGKTSLKSIELEEVGEVGGKSLLHLQCHFGQDTLSWARLGAEATGVDFSDKAIQLARQLSEELQLNARFVLANIYDLPQHLEGNFDIVFTSYGVIGWLPDLERWAQVVAHFLKPGGAFHLVEFHPVVWMYDWGFEKIIYSYFNTGPIAEQNTGTYADRSANLSHWEYGWNHSLSDVVNALIRQGLRLEYLNEFPYTPHKCFSNLEQLVDGNWRVTHLPEQLPMVFSLKAVK